MIKVETERYDKSSQKTTRKKRYYISNHASNTKKINQTIRGPLSVQNHFHGVLGIVFGENKSRRRIGNSVVNFNIISK